MTHKADSKDVDLVPESSSDDASQVEAPVATRDILQPSVEPRARRTL